MQTVYWAFLVVAVECGLGQLVDANRPMKTYAPNTPFREDVARHNNNVGGWSREAWDETGVMVGLVWDTYPDGTERIKRWDGTFFVRPVKKEKP